MGGADGRVDEDRMCAVQHVTNGGGLHHQVLHAGARELTLSPLPGREGRVLLPSLAGRGWGGSKRDLPSAPFVEPNVRCDDHPSTLTPALFLPGRGSQDKKKPTDGPWVFRSDILVFDQSN